MKRSALHYLTYLYPTEYNIIDVSSLSQHTLLLIQEFNSRQRILEYVWWIASSLSYLLHDVLDTVLCELEVFSQLLPVIVDLINHFDT